MARVTITARVYSKSGALLATGVNSYTKTHPIQYKYACKAGKPYKMYLHAEISAIIKALKVNSNPYKIEVIRIGKDGRLRMAKPCLVCMEAIRDAGIKKIRYTTNSGWSTMRL